jgi:hypothetical protein
MANVVRDPRERQDAIIPDLATDTIAKFTKDQVALSTEAFGSNVTSLSLATTTSPSQPNGASQITFGVLIL